MISSVAGNVPDPDFGALRSAAPDAYAALVTAAALADTIADADLLAVVRNRVIAGLLHDTEERSEATTALGEAVAGFVDQYVLYVSGIDDNLRQPLENSLPERELHLLVKALYIIDASFRLRLLHRSLFGSGNAILGSLASPASEAPPALKRDEATEKVVDTAIMDIWRTATAAAESSLDPEDVEYLRLRSGWYHNCRQCLASRVAVEGQVLVDEATFDKIKVYETRDDISARHKAILALEDAFLMNPRDGISDELRDELARHFTTEQIVALTLKAVNFCGQKMGVALDADRPRQIDANDKLTAEGNRISEFYAYSRRNLQSDRIDLRR